ncbi:MAG: acetyl-CoA carboxylase biotin carboxyl carrier protein [bacterium]|nr:acetyl-CoA carboxylase biotin carboxyl carrier protein [bacterium]MDD5354188.1 acetyl-CoA carboxylase biotin carboxyl carrier protein [bacterium]MDD5756330.1 acetyl-CoA carboxylase biotin carboxyl carrier protein [bacterium]
MDTKDIKKFLEIIADTDIVELNWEKDGQKIGFRKNEGAVINPLQEEAASTDTLKSNGNGKSKEQVANVEVSQNYHTIKSTMVGTFFTAPAPDSPPYIQEGTVIKKGQKIAVIEAMKIMKDVVSDTDGKLIKILLENGHHVEYGQPIFTIQLHPTE